MSAPTPRPFALGSLEACHHAIAVLELEKAKHKLSARILALKLARAERLLKQVRETKFLHPPLAPALSNTRQRVEMACHDLDRARRELYSLSTALWNLTNRIQASVHDIQTLTGGMR
jgi:hypothetical protein